jgi:hypothetical protein
LESGLLDETRGHAALNEVESIGKPRTSAQRQKKVDFHGASSSTWSHDVQPYDARCRVSTHRGRVHHDAKWPDHHRRCHGQAPARHRHPNRPKASNNRLPEGNQSVDTHHLTRAKDAQAVLGDGFRRPCRPATERRHPHRWLRARARQGSNRPKRKQTGNCPVLC